MIDRLKALMDIRREEWPFALLTWGLYGALGITREMKAEMSAQRARNYLFFDAPVGMIFGIDRRLNVGSWMDLGMFLQNIMIAARGHGMHTCAQASFADYPSIVRKHLNMPEEEVIVCGMALGYRDPDAPENVWRTERDPVERFTSWSGTGSSGFTRGGSSRSP